MQARRPGSASFHLGLHFILRVEGTGQALRKAGHGYKVGYKFRIRYQTRGFV